MASNFAIPAPGGPSRISPRSIGVKLIVVCFLAVSMTIPGLYVGGLIEERTERAAQVVKEISKYSGGPQTVLGPCMVIPYTAVTRYAAGPSSRAVYVVFPAEASATLKTATEERRRTLFKVPVFRADLRFDATFDLAATPAALPPGVELDWSRAEIVVGMTDLRGALADATLTVNEKVTIMTPARILPNISFGGDASRNLKLTLLAAAAGTPVKPDSRFRVTSSMQFSGAQRVAVLAYGKATQLSARGDWPDPGFDGGFLPVKRAIAKDGFTAEWSIPYIARGVPAEGPVESTSALEATSLGTSFIEVADPYQSVNRCLKYVILFLGLIFLSYFVLEVTTGKRVHPAQYILVGVAQLIFYLLLLSVAERIGFNWAFLIGGAATVALLSINAVWVFSSLREGFRGLVTFTLLYGLIFLLLRAEESALLIGAVASFVAVATTMYFTRKIDWYSPRPPSRVPVAPLAPTPPGSQS